MRFDIVAYNLNNWDAKSANDHNKKETRRRNQLKTKQNKVTNKSKEKRKTNKKKENKERKERTNFIPTDSTTILC